MKLHNLRPAKGATHKEKRLAVVKQAVKVVLLQKVIKVDQSRAGYQKQRWHMKVDRCLFSVVFQNVDLKTPIVLNTKYSILVRLINWLKNMNYRIYHWKLIYQWIDQPERITLKFWVMAN